MQGDSIKQLKWFDKTQTAPNEVEVQKAKQTRIANMEARETKKAQARLEIKNATTPINKKIDDLILDLDQ